jgi:hypothetical protein
VEVNMRLVAIIMAAVIASASLGSTAFAAPGKGKTWHKHKHSYAYLKRKSREETYDDIRANYLDPAGDYKAYPSWARAALAPKGPDGMRF